MSALPDWQISWIKAGHKRDPFSFVTGVLGVPAYDPSRPGETMELWQQEALQAIRDGKTRISVKSGHGVGKTTLISWVTLWALLCLGLDTKVPIAAGSQKQLQDTIQPEIAKWVKRLPADLSNEIDVQKERVVLKRAPEEVFAVFRTASKDNPDALQGFHAKNIVFLVDEASAVADIAFEVAQGALSTPGAITMIFGNPTKATGYFYDTHHKLRHRFHCMTVNSEDVPRARGHIEDVITAYGKNSNRYRVRVLGEFPTHDDEAVIPLDLILAAKGRQVQISNVFPVWGVDVARFGDDTSTIVKRQGNSLKYDDGRPPIFEWHGLDGAQVAGRIQAEYRATALPHRPKEIVVDVIGVGAAVYDILRLQGSECREITRGANVSEAAASSEEDHRLRDELWFRGAQWFRERTCHFPSSLPTPSDWALVEKLIGELSQPTFDFTGVGKRIVESKKEMKKRNLPSPNLADGFLLTFAAGVYPRIDPHRRPTYEQPLSWRAA